MSQRDHYSLLRGFCSGLTGHVRGSFRRHAAPQLYDPGLLNDEELPPYAILSHTWGPDEVTYQEQRLMYRIGTLPPDLQQDRAYIAALEVAAGLDFMTVDGEAFTRRTGYSKIKGTALIAQASGIKWFWVDTCCIRNVAQV
jgi:hypothetical protein